MTLNSVEQADAVYDVLVNDCGAIEGEREAFRAHWPNCREWRFRGTLGFGGKVWMGDWRHAPWVTCYQEDETPERLETIARTNARFERIEAKLNDDWL